MPSSDHSVSQGRAGIRGGPRPAETLLDARRLFETWRAEDFGWIQARIMRLALRFGEYHADDIADVHLTNPNVIGVAVAALRNRGLIEKLNRWGEPEHRPAQSAASRGRASWVWRLTDTGLHYAQELRRLAPNLSEPPDPQQPLFELRTAPVPHHRWENAAA